MVEADGQEIFNFSPSRMDKTGPFDIFFTESFCIEPKMKYLLKYLHKRNFCINRYMN